MSVDLRVYAELNDFVKPDEQYTVMRRPFQPHQTVKDVVEAAGIPHTEVDLVLINGESVDFDHRPRHGDRITAYPVFETLDIARVTRVRPRPLREPRFVADVNLGGLAKLMRLMGLDVRCQWDNDDAALAEVAGGRSPHPAHPRPRTAQAPQRHPRCVRPVRSPVRSGRRGDPAAGPGRAAGAVHPLPALRWRRRRGSQGRRRGPARAAHAPLLRRVPSLYRVRPGLLAGLAPGPAQRDGSGDPGRAESARCFTSAIARFAMNTRRLRRRPIK